MSNKNILILTTKDNFYLKRLLLKLEKNKKYNFYFIFENEYDNLSNIISKLCLLGLINSSIFLLKDLYFKLKKKSIENIINSKSKISEKSNKAIINLIKQKKISLLISINYPKKISENLFNLPKYGAINLHLGKLPKHKGRSPVASAILKREKNFTITMHKINKYFDEGPIVFEKEFSVKKYDILKIYDKFFSLSYNLILKSLNFNYSNKKKYKKNHYSKYIKLSLIQKIKVYLILNWGL
jgi:folate-dependent phosphoribosylglycinamide formyltransferase PurN